MLSDNYLSFLAILCLLQYNWISFMKKSSILLIDDDDSLRRVMEFSLTEAGYTVQTAASGEDGLRLFEKDAFDAVITDITMPGMSGMEVLAKVRERDAHMPVIVITAYGTIESAVEAMKQGAFDYITKPFNRDELRLTLEKALRMRRLEKENVELRAEVTDRYRFESIIGSSEKIRDVLDLAGRVAASDATVLITGESGTGKELAGQRHSFQQRPLSGAVRCGELRRDSRDPDRERAVRACERRIYRRRAGQGREIRTCRRRNAVPRRDRRPAHRPSGKDPAGAPGTGGGPGRRYGSRFPSMCGSSPQRTRTSNGPSRKEPSAKTSTTG